MSGLLLYLVAIGPQLFGTGTSVTPGIRISGYTGSSGTVEIVALG